VSDGFVRIAIYRDGKRTSVSLDDVLFSALCARQGGAEAAAQWVREAADRVPQLREAADPVVLVDKPAFRAWCNGWRWPTSFRAFQPLAKKSPAAGMRVMARRTAR